jgi:hypothetical protein
MLFNIEADRGDQIVGYLVPDDYTRTPTLRVYLDGTYFADLPCDQERPSLVVAGRHATGRCGFAIDSAIIPGIERKGGIELFDAETGVLVYRRRTLGEVTQQKIFRLETHLFPLWRLDESVDAKFQYFHKGIERHGRETATQVFQLSNASSLYLSGRLAFKVYENHIHDTFRSVLLMHEPYCELAERLLTLKHVSKFGDELLGARDMVSFRAAIEFAQEIEADETKLRRAFDSMPKEAIASLTSPLTRQLSADALDEPPPKGAIARALSALSSFAVVGLREQEELFLEGFEALVDVPAGTAPPLPYFPNVSTLARALRAVPETELLIEQDLEIYHTVKEAIGSTL